MYDTITHYSTTLLPFITTIYSTPRTHPNQILWDSLIQIPLKFIPRNHVERTERCRCFEWLAAKKDSDKVWRGGGWGRGFLLFPEFKDDFGTHPWPHWLYIPLESVLESSLKVPEKKKTTKHTLSIWRTPRTGEIDPSCAKLVPSYRFSQNLKIILYKLTCGSIWHCWNHQSCH